MVKVAYAVEPDGIADVGDLLIGMDEQVRGIIQPQVVDKLQRSTIHFFPELPAKIGMTIVG